jgi:hypothetical protein
VSELIDHTSAAWDWAKLQKFFMQADINVILNISMYSRSQPDFWAWHHDKKGVFTVCFAYRMLIMRRASSENTARSNRKEEEKEWTSLWHVMVPSKVRVFLWRLARHSLPSANVLHHRNMADHGRCALCGVLIPGNTLCWSVIW